MIFVYFSELALAFVCGCGCVVCVGVGVGGYLLSLIQHVKTIKYQQIPANHSLHGCFSLCYSLANVFHRAIALLT